MNKVFLALGLGIAVFAACNPTTVTPSYSATLSGAAEKPNAVTTSGTGTATATLDGTTLNLTITYSGLSGAATAAHIHGLADENSTAGVLCNFSTKITEGATAGSGSISTTCNLDGVSNVALTVANLDAGKFYVNLHTAANAGGEVRGQLIKK